jgi:hypothetical protein
MPAAAPQRPVAVLFPRPACLRVSAPDQLMADMLDSNDAFRPGAAAVGRSVNQAVEISFMGAFSFNYEISGGEDKSPASRGRHTPVRICPLRNLRAPRPAGPRSFVELWLNSGVRSKRTGGR